MSEFIPFANTDRDWLILNKHFSTAEVVRTTCDSVSKASKRRPGQKLWIDAGVDGLEQWPQINDGFRRHVSSWLEPESILDVAFQKKPDRNRVNGFVESVLDQIAAKAVPDWISVPQLPCTTGSNRNRINRQLATATAEWAAKNRFKGRLVLPLIVSHNSQIKLKQERNKKLELLFDCLDESGARDLWVVDRSLNDQDGTSSVREYRLKAVIDFHQEIREKADRSLTVIAGPYWGLNLILWCKGLIQHPAIGMGNAFQYRLPGGHMQQGKSRIAINALKRTAIASPSLFEWLQSTLLAVSRSDPASAEITGLIKAFPQLQADGGRSQIAFTYSHWLDRLQHLPPSGRALGLYQDFSSAYVFGKPLEALPQDEGSARRPERVAEQLMLYCL